MYGRGPNATNGGPPGAAAPTGPGVPGVKTEPASYGTGYGTNGYGTVIIQKNIYQWIVQKKCTTFLL